MAAYVKVFTVSVEISEVKIGRSPGVLVLCLRKSRRQARQDAQHECDPADRKHPKPFDFRKSCPHRDHRYKRLRKGPYCPDQGRFNKFLPVHLFFILSVVASVLVTMQASAPHSHFLFFKRFYPALQFVHPLHHVVVLVNLFLQLFQPVCHKRRLLPVADIDPQKSKSGSDHSNSNGLPVHPLLHLLPRR